MLNGAVHVILSWESGFEWFIQRGSKTIDTRWFVFVCYNGNIRIYQFGGPFSIVCLWKSMDGTKENPYAFVVYKFISVTYVISSGSKGNILFLRHRLAFEKKAIELALRKTFIVNECMRCSLRKTNNTHICNKFGRNEQRKKNACIQYFVLNCATLKQRAWMRISSTHLPTQLAVKSKFFNLLITCRYFWQIDTSYISAPSSYGWRFWILIHHDRPSTMVCMTKKYHFLFNDFTWLCQLDTCSNRILSIARAIQLNFLKHW